MATYFQNFKRDDGAAITVEYEIAEGEGNFDYPGHICDGGGSGPEVAIVSAFNDDATLHLLRSGGLRTRFIRWGLGLRFIGAIIARRVLTDAEEDRFCDWIAEHHEFDYSDEYDYERA